MAFYPQNLSNAFEFLPSLGASGGVITIWKSRFFTGFLTFRNEFGISMDFKSLNNDASWILTNVYGPCTPEGKRIFVHWLKNIQMPEDWDWLIVEDFIFYRSPDNRNKHGGDIQEMFLFNEAINAQGWVELSFHERKFTWTNKQESLLLERVDLFFSSIS